jgi:CheY-like chemotaxis protein
LHFAEPVLKCGVPATNTKLWRVLLVDDDPLVSDSIRRMLEFDNHCRVRSAASGVDALAICEKDTFDLIILDYLMPVMRGDTLAVILKAIYPDLPILMITADAEKQESKAAPPPGVDIVMGKPFQLNELRETVARLMSPTRNTEAANSQAVNRSPA